MTRLGLALSWLVPLIVAIEFVGSAVAQSIGSTLGLLALFLGSLWLPVAPEPETTPAPTWLRRALGGLLLLAGGAVLAFGVTRILEPARFPPASLPEWLRTYEWTVLTPVIACWPVALAIPWLFGKRLGGRDLERAGLLVALVFLALLQMKVRVQGLPVLPYAKPWLPTLLGAIAVVIAIVALAPRLPPFARFAIVVGAAVVLRAVGLETVKLDPAVRDMLPLVKSAQDAFAAGMNPYDLHQMQRGSVVPLTYLPGMWLLHGVPRLVGLDLRWTGILADAGVASMLWWAASRVEARYRATARGLALAFAAAWLFSPSVHWNGLYAEPHAWWLVLSIVIAATVRRRFWLAAAALGIALATRHFALVVAPFVIVHMWRTLGWRAALARAGLTGAIAALLLVWFAAPDPDTFWFGTYRWLVEYGPAHQSWFWFKFGFSGPLYKADAAAWMPRAQVAIVLAMLVVAAFVRGPRAFLAPAGSAYVLFVMFNGIIWDSFYLGAALFPAFAAAAAHPTPHAAPERLERRSFVLGAAAAAVAALAGVGLIVTLVQSLSSSGKGAARSFVAREVKPGEALIDRSDWQLAFVRGKPLFASTPAPTRLVGDHPFAPSLGAAGAFETPRLWLVTRGSRDERLREQLAAFGAPRHEQFGSVHVTSVPVGPIQTRLSGLTSELSPAFNSEPLTPTGAGSWRSPSVTYVEVARRACRIGGGARIMLYAHPATGGKLRLSFGNVALGSALVVFGGIDDSAVVWGRADVDVAIAIDGKMSGDLRLRNRPGAEWIALDTSKYGAGVHQVELVLSVAGRDDVQRFACVEGLVLGRSSGG